MKEREIERKFKKAVEKMGGLALKFVSPGLDGVPDRLVLFKGGIVAFVEVKRYGVAPRPLQLKVHQQLRELGFKVFVLDNEGDIGGIIDEIRGA